MHTEEISAHWSAMEVSAAFSRCVSQRLTTPKASITGTIATSQTTQDDKEWSMVSQDTG
jgi:hypothetical protein